MCASSPQSTGIIELGYRSIRKFFLEHPMATRRRPGIPWSRFGLFPFLLILVVLLGALGVPDLFDKAVDEAQTRSSQYVPRQLEPPLWLEGFPRQRRILWLISWCWLP